MKDNQNLHRHESTCAPAESETRPLRRILVVDDDKLIRQLNSEVLRKSGYRVDTAQDGEAGWQALHAVRYSPDSYALLITDHDMPGLSGLDLIRRLRAVSMTLPVIMATGKLPVNEFTRHAWLQPAVMLLKPYTAATLLGTVKEALPVSDDGAAAQAVRSPNRTAGHQLTICSEDDAAPGSGVRLTTP